MTNRNTTPAVVLVVTWNSADDLPPLLATLRESTLGADLVVVDNDSEDDTVAVAAELAPDARVLQTGRNAGYAAAINHGLAEVPADRHVLVVNPDVRLHPDALSALLTAAAAGVGVVVPRIRDESGTTAPSLRRDPTAWRTLAEALLGGRHASTLGLGERVTAPVAYDHGHAVDWATGAAMLLTPVARAAVGEWDERYFLYSEEVDYCQRVRDAGLEVRYEPRAVVTHVGGDLATSPRLWALRAVNRVRHQRLRRGDRAVGFHVASLLFEARRRLGGGDEPAAEAVRRLARGDLDAEAAALTPEVPATPLAAPVAVVVPAHDEEATIAMTLRSLLHEAEDGEVELVVAANGCRDDTARIARTAAPGARILDLASPSKTAAMNAADRTLDIPDREIPVAYVDADIVLTTHALRRMVRAFEDGGALAVAPTPRYDLDSASWPVRSYLRIWQRLPFTHDALSGTGAFMLSPEGRRRLGTFPDVRNDDAWVNAQFAPGERRRVSGAVSHVTAPPDLSTLVRRKLRVEVSNKRIRHATSTADEPTRWPDLARIVRDRPRLLLDLPAFLLVTAVVRLRARLRRSPVRWR